MNFCKDCKHFRAKEFNGAIEYGFSRCALFIKTTTCPVSGETNEQGGYCDNNRKTGFECGPEAKLFEPKESL